MELTALDFQQARVKQVLFKSRLRSVLYGVRQAEPSLFSMQENPLGQWVAAVLKPQYGHRPEVAGIERLIRQTLDTGQALVRQHPPAARWNRPAPAWSKSSAWPAKSTSC